MLGLHTLILSHALLLAPVEPALEPGTVAAAEPDTEAVVEAPLVYAELVAELVAANTAATEDPDVGPERLAKAILGFRDHAPELAADVETQRLRVEAMLNLARLQASTSMDLAAKTMDMAIREAHGDTLPVADFGPRLEDLYEQRLAAMNYGGTATIEVKCTIRCRIYIDGREKPIVSGPLHLGPHEIWIEDYNGRHPQLRKQEMLSTAGETIVLDYGPAPKPEVKPVSVPKLGRVMPAWAEAMLITLGTGMLIGGSVALSMHSYYPESFSDCPKLFDARALGTALLGIGGISFGVGVAAGAVDRRRMSGPELSMSVGWRVQF